MTDRNDIKNAIDDIKPDAYMKTRLSAKIADYKKPRRSVALKKAGAGILAFAILCGCFGAYEALNKGNDYGKTDLNNDFTIIAYASDGKQITNEAPLTEDKITLPEVRIKKDDYGDNVLCGSGGFIIDADDIDSIKIKSELGEFIYWDSPRQDYDERVKGRINYIKIPLTDEEYTDYKRNYSKYGYGLNGIEKRREFAEKIIKGKDCKKYFGNNSMNLKHYDFEISSKEDSTEEINTLVLSNNDKIEKRYYHMNESECVIKQYDSKEKVEIGYMNNYALDYFDDESLDVSKMPKDTITITVYFNNGQEVTKRLNTSFNANGIMEIEFIK